MIKDLLKNSNNYKGISKNLDKGLTWLESIDLEKLQDGQYEINNKDIYASIQTYETKDDAKYESHKKYVDIQYIINGSEKIGVTDLSNCNTCTEYNEDKDIEFYDIKIKDEYFELKTGQFMIFFPNDAHKPSISLNEKSTVKKIVVKVAI